MKPSTLRPWPPRILIGTNNPGKLAEIRASVPSTVELVSASELGLPAPEETGHTLEANALLKAEAYGVASGLPCLADDSGLLVVALGGAPGVHSARFAGPQADDTANIEALLSQMATKANRSAALHTVLCYWQPDASPIFFRGSLAGRIATEPLGANGFGYDPIFILPGGRTLAELSLAEKSLVSHRSMALRAFLQSFAS
jgi:XTP/dITP diphosphohydrolase